MASKHFHTSRLLLQQAKSSISKTTSKAFGVSLLFSDYQQKAGTKITLNLSHFTAVYVESVKKILSYRGHLIQDQDYLTEARESHSPKSTHGLGLTLGGSTASRSKAFTLAQCTMCPVSGPKTLYLYK